MINDIYEEGHKGHTFVIDGKGEVVTHDDKSKLYSNMKELPLIKKVLSEQENGAFSVELEDVKQTVFYKTSAYTGWKIVSIVPDSQIYKPLTVTRNLLAAFAMGMFIIAFIIMFLVGRKTFRPIDLLIGRLSGKYKHVQPGQVGRGVTYLETIFDQMFMDREELEKQVRDSKPMLKWRTVMDMLIGYRTEYSMVKHHLEFTGVRLFPEHFVVCTAEIGKEGGINPQDEMLYTYALCNVAEEIINMENAGVAIDLGGGRAVILFSFEEGDEEQNSLRVATLLEHILEVMNRQIGLTVTAGVGRGYKNMKHISLSYEESQQALKYKMVTGNHSVISIEDLQMPDNQDYYRIAQMIDRILDALKLTDTTKMNTLLQETFKEAVKSNLSPDLIRQFSFELVMRSTQTMESIGFETEEILVGIGNLHERIHQCENWKQTERLVGSVLENLAAVILEKRQQRGKNDTIGQIFLYIQEHYQDSGLSLDRLADEFHLNPTYISKLFKEHAEGNFIDYLIEIRIRASKELLKDKNIKISDISYAVGYTNSRSFMRTFKKYTGLTPTEYRERIAGQGQV
jgi:AraC-like DNA-binding protein